MTLAVQTPKKIPFSPSFERRQSMLQEAARLLPGFSEDLTHATLGVGVQAYDGLFSRVFTFFYDVLHLSSGRDKLLALFQNACKLQHARLPAGSEDALGLLGAHDSISSSRKAFRFLKWVREVYKVRASALAVLRIPLVPFARAWRGGSLLYSDRCAAASTASRRGARPRAPCSACRRRAARSTPSATRARFATSYWTICCTRSESRTRNLLIPGSQPADQDTLRALVQVGGVGGARAREQAAAQPDQEPDAHWAPGLRRRGEREGRRAPHSTASQRGGSGYSHVPRCDDAMICNSVRCDARQAPRRPRRRVGGDAPAQPVLLLAYVA